MKDLECTVISNREVSRQTFLMNLACRMESFIPGQFVMLKIGKTNDPLLRRPLGILAYTRGTLALLYRVKGAGTRHLSTLKEQETVFLLGPLGNGFALPHAEEIVYVAGGTGLPPLLALANHLGRGHFFLGAHSSADIPFECFKRAVTIATEDGSFGLKGLATDLFEAFPLKSDFLIYACGPSGMLKAVSEIAHKSGARCLVSLEERMACGFGVCSGCAVETRSGTRRVCTDGPVFDAADILW